MLKYQRELCTFSPLPPVMKIDIFFILFNDCDRMISVLTTVFEDLLSGEQVDVLSTVFKDLLRGEQVDGQTAVYEARACS